MLGWRQYVEFELKNMSDVINFPQNDTRIFKKEQSVR